jgi:hypothetical protein
VVCLPFFLAAPGAMWRMVVLDQFGRARGVGVGRRLAEITSVSPIASGWSPLLVVVLGIVAVAAVLAWRLSTARPSVLLLVAYTAMLMATPTWFFHYTGLTAPVLAIVCAAGVQQLVDLPAIRDRRRLRIGVIVASLAALALPALFVAQLSEGERFPTRQFAAAVAGGSGCVTSDHPTALILTDIVGRNIARGCPLIIDLGGYTHDLGRGQYQSRRGNRAFQEYALDYLRTGDLAILARFSEQVGWSRATLRELERWPVITESGDRSVRAPR